MSDDDVQEIPPDQEASSQEEEVIRIPI